MGSEIILSMLKVFQDLKKTCDSAYEIELFIFSKEVINR